MPTPTIHDLSTDYALYGLEKWQADALRQKCIWNRAGKRPLKIILHIQDGQTRGSLLWWLGVSASANYMANRDGTLLKVIPEAHGPWTNGDVCSPQTAELGIVPADFWNDPNPYSLTIEAEGTPSEPLTPVQLDSIEWLVRDMMARYPDIKPSDIERHRNINTCTRWNCPGRDDTNDYYIAITQRIGNVQVPAEPTTPYAMPITYDWLQPEELKLGKDREIKSGSGKITKIYALRREWTCREQTHRYRTASTSGKLSNRVGPDLYPGQSFIGEFVFETADNWWILTEYGTRILMSKMEPPFFGVIDRAAKR